MARKNSTDKIKGLQEQIRKMEQKLKEEQRKRDEELGKIFREEWNIEDAETAQLIIQSLRNDVEKLIQSAQQSEPINTKDDPETIVS